jgi:hypothetical protein
MTELSFETTPVEKGHKQAAIYCLSLKEERLLESISPTFYTHLLHVQIPKAQKDSLVISVFFVLLGSSRAKAAHKTLAKLTS